MIVSQQQRQTAWRLADEHGWGRRVMHDNDRQWLAEVVVREFEKETAHANPSRAFVASRVKADPDVRRMKPKGFLGTVIIGAVISFIIQRLLGYLWDEWNKDQEREQLRKVGWPTGPD
jgi:hypothetical protein